MQASVEQTSAATGQKGQSSRENERAALEALINYVADITAPSNSDRRRNHADALRKSLGDVLDPQLS